MTDTPHPTGKHASSNSVTTPPPLQREGTVPPPSQDWHDANQSAMKRALELLDDFVALVEQGAKRPELAVWLAMVIAKERETAQAESSKERR